MMLYQLDFEKRAIDVGRKATDDIGDCASAEVSVFWHGLAPVLRFVFGDPRLRGRPSLGVQMIAVSRKNPLAPGRLLEGDELRRRVRSKIDEYFKINGIELSRKIVTDAHL